MNVNNFFHVFSLFRFYDAYLEKVPFLSLAKYAPTGHQGHNGLCVLGGLCERNYNPMDLF